MFTFALIDTENRVLSIQRSTFDILLRPFERWVIIQSGQKWRQNLTYNEITRGAE